MPAWEARKSATAFCTRLGFYHSGGGGGDMTDRRESTPLRDMGSWLKWLAGIALAAFLGYTATVNALNTRIAVIESRVDALKSDISEIKADVKQLLREGR